MMAPVPTTAPGSVTIVPRILAFAGSVRKESFNKKLVQIAATGARAAGAEVMYIDLRDYPLPLFDQDLESEHGLPENAGKLKTLMLSHHGFLISAPEYNSSITPLLKNTIDWASRPVAGEPPLACFSGKAAVIMSASPGALGGLRGLVHLRAILGNIGTHVLPATHSLAKATDAFAADGSLVDRGRHETIEQLGGQLAAFLRKLLA
ncbi:MAG: NAD(P)H-dependent oxidoreductase [Pirellulales bacterium]